MLQPFCDWFSLTAPPTSTTIATTAAGTARAAATRTASTSTARLVASSFFLPLRDREDRTACDTTRVATPTPSRPLTTPPAA
ncbi:hypothetical protein GCM10010413_55660 [Promicromonospora sukumoe]